MSNTGGKKVWASLVVGLAGGLLLYHSILWVNDLAITPRQEMEKQNELVATLQEENQQLFDELFKPRGEGMLSPYDGKPPYDESRDASLDVAEARKKALDEKKFLMVTFGANWCQDCRNLHRILKSEEVQDYTRDVFDFVNVDVGKFNQNTQLATELGVSLRRGIPVAIIFDTDGQVIGTTNERQLEPARRYSSMQLLKFVRDVAERSRILAPDAVQ
jgi:thioredoxin-related protein